MSNLTDRDLAVWRRLAIPLLLFLLLSGQVASAEADRRIALVIGNGNYATAAWRLKNPVNDAKKMAAMLRRAGFDVIEQEDATRRMMIQSLRSFNDKLSPGGVGLIYYAGHGVQAQGANYLLPVDATLAFADDLRYETLDLQDILDRLNDARIRLGIVILDACRDNPFAKSARSTVLGLGKIDPPRGMIIAYSTSPGNVAADGDGDGSIYTSELLNAMSEPGRRLQEVFEHVTDAVEQRTRDRPPKQTPWTNSSFRGDFYFFGPITMTVAPFPDPAVAATSAEIVFWQSITGSTNPADFEAYLKQFPQGSFVALAQNRLASLAAHPVPDRPAPSPDLRSPDANTPKLPPAALGKQKPASLDATNSQPAPPPRKDVPPAAMKTSEPPDVPPIKQSATPQPASSAHPPPRAVAPLPGIAVVPSRQQEAMVRPPPTVTMQPTPSQSVPPPATAPGLPAEQSPSRPLCTIPFFNGMETAAGGYATIRVANTATRCGINLRYGPLRQPFNSLSLSKLPSHGSVTVEGSAFYYTPFPGYVGEDDFAIASTPWGHVRAVVTVVPPETK